MLDGQPTRLRLLTAAGALHRDMGQYRYHQAGQYCYHQATATADRDRAAEALGSQAAEPSGKPGSSPPKPPSATPGAVGARGSDPSTAGTASPRPNGK